MKKFLTQITKAVLHHTGTKPKQLELTNPMNACSSCGTLMVMDSSEGCCAGDAQMRTRYRATGTRQVSWYQTRDGGILHIDEVSSMLRSNVKVSIDGRPVRSVKFLMRR